jgi:UDP-N-acetylglucosamine/UDP-N-acetyl-alpha-D-glucosaminouronate 4-epimerase
MTNVVLTGGLGFIGSHLIDRLLEDDYDVSVIDDSTTGQTQNVVQHEKNARLKLFKGSILEKSRISELVSNADVVVHLAAITSVIRSWKEPAMVHDVNVSGTLNVLESCVEHSVKRLVFISSAAVYGNRSSPPFKEELSLHPQSLYGATKAAGEAYCEAFHETHQIDTVVIRLMNIYGPRRSPGPYAGVMMNFGEAVTKQNPITIYGDGEQTRDFTYATDAAEGIKLALECHQAAGEIFNIGTGMPCTVNHLAERFMQISNRRLPVSHVLPRRGEVRHSFADLTKATSLLGYRPNVPLEDGLRLFLDWYRESALTEAAALR